MFLFGIIFNGEVLKLRNIYDLTRKEFEDYFVSIGDKKFRSVQLYEFLYKKRINNTSEMNNIGNNIKERLNNDFSFDMIKLVVKQEDNLVKKYKSFQKLLLSDITELDEVDGIGEVRAKTIVQTLKRMQEQFVFDRMIV